jgi:hypothetical protein
VKLDDLAHAEEEREIDHAVRGLRHRLGDPESQEREVREDRAKRALRLWPQDTTLRWRGSIAC